MSKKENTFLFMLKEYEMLYSKFEMHYSAVEKTISLYFIIIGAILSANSFFIKDFNNFSIFSLTEFQIFCCIFIFILGSVNLLKVIEHRLLIITYVKNLNQNRKWFIEKFEKEQLQKYSIFETTYKSPKYYKKYRHFYWEVLGIGIINSSFLSLAIINLLRIFQLQSKYYIIINWLFFILISLISTILFMGYYKFKGNHMEKDLLKRNLA